MPRYHFAVHQREWSETAQTTVRWGIEFENGERSAAYSSETEAWAALFDLQSSQAQMSLLYSRPMWLFSSDGLRFAIPMKTNG
jgi:hypothetical protein